MSLSINTNVGAMVALESLNATTDALDQTQNAVSTGLKVGSASDNPATYAISQSMTGNIQGLSAVSDGLAYASQTVSTTSTAVSGILSTLKDLQQAVTSISTYTGDTVSLTKVSQEINGYLDSINTQARNATFNGINLLATKTDANVANQGSALGAVTGIDLTYLTGLQGSTTKISNIFTTTGANAVSVPSAVGYMTAVAASSALTLTDFLGLSGTKATPATAGQVNAINVFLDGNGNILDKDAGGNVSDNAASDMVTVVQNAIVAMNKFAATLGSNTQTITSLTSYSANLSDSLTSGVGALTDADMAAESAKLTSLQTKQQLAISALSVAKSSSQNILSLFR